MQVLVPLVRLIAVHAVEKQRQAGIVLQRFLHFRSALERLFQRPLGRDAGMDHGDIPRLVMVQQLLPAQPVEQFGTVRCLDDLAQGIGLAQTLDIVGHGQQVQVVVAEHADQGFADRIKEAQGFQGFRSAVDQVAHQPEAIPGWIEADSLQQALQLVQASLEIADRISRHAALLSAGRRERRGGRGR
ncbi:hypothetical protein D3C76_1155580 [compost metagenome]